MKKLVIIGGHGSGEIAARIAEAIGDWKITGFLNDYIPKDSIIYGYPVVGKISEANSIEFSGNYFAFTLHSHREAKYRFSILQNLNIPKESMATLIHPKAEISKDTKIGPGSIISEFATIQPNVKIGSYAQIRSNVVISHGSKISDFCFFASGAIIAGRVTIYEGVHVGINSTVIEDQNIGKWSVIGAGSVVVKEVEAYSKIIGNPAKKVGVINS